MDLIEIFAGSAASGDVVREELPARKISDGVYELLASPGLALHVAKGDIIRISSSATPVEIVRRGGNLCVQIYAENDLPPDERKQIDSAFHLALPGSVDGETDKNMCFSIPVSVGFNAVEHFFNDLSARLGNISWYYGNVYGEDGVTPLNWWASSETS